VDIEEGGGVGRMRFAPEDIIGHLRTIEIEWGCVDLAHVGQTKRIAEVRCLTQGTRLVLCDLGLGRWE